MDYLPIFLDLRSRRVLVVGDTPAAQSKTRLLRQAGADVRTVPAQSFRPAEVEGCAAVIGAAGDPERDRQVADAARSVGVPVNIVDRPELSTFIVPAIVDRGPVVVAISTGGAAPVLARRLRQQIEALLPTRLGDLARVAARFRRALRDVVQDDVMRRRFWERFFDGPLAERVLAGDGRVAGEMVALVNRAPEATKGVVYVVGAGAGDADLLTLQALRLMQQADVVVHDATITPDILDRVRRDAERLPIDGLGAGADEFIRRAAAAGQRVLRLVRDEGDVDIHRLRSHGFEVVVAPGLTAAAIEAWRPAPPQRIAV